MADTAATAEIIYRPKHISDCMYNFDKNIYNTAQKDLILSNNCILLLLFIVYTNKLNMGYTSQTAQLVLKTIGNLDTKIRNTKGHGIRP